VNQELNIELAALRRMSPAQLRAKYLEVFGESSRSGNKDFLFKRLAWRMQSLVEGTLSDRARQRAEELARDADIRMTMPKLRSTTPNAPKSVLPAPTMHDKSLPIPGTMLVRQYRGQTISVQVLANGFEWEGQVYRSLSAVAKKVTGSHWNGRLFFGLTNGGKK
jgi:Protein of unknown function (DUF2924)